MFFNHFIFIVGCIWSGYYLLVILFDLVNSPNKPATVTTHHIQFESEKAVLINDESNSTNHLGKNGLVPDANEEFILKDSRNDINSTDITNSLMVDLGLETISGEAYEVSAENLSEYMKV